MGLSVSPAADPGAELWSHPAWYGSVMSTGGVAILLNNQAALWGWDWLVPVAGLLLLVTSVLAVLLLPRYAVRLRDVRGSGQLASPEGALLATFPAGVMMLASAWGRVGPVIVPTIVALAVAAVLCAVGIAAVLWFGQLWLGALSAATTPLDLVNGGWLIPAVMHLLVPIALAPVIAAGGPLALPLALVGLAFAGLGLLLFLFVQSLIVARLILRPPLPPDLVATAWVPLAPGALLGAALLALGSASKTAGLTGVDLGALPVAVAAMGLGFSLWWAVSATLQTRVALRAGPIRRTPGWWAFVFPTAAVALSLTVIASTLESPPIAGLSLIAAVGVVAVWAFVGVRTMRRGARRPAAA